METMDSTLFHKIKSGDKSAFQKLYNEYIDKALRTAIAVTRNKEMAKDAVQETFIRIFKNIGSYDAAKPFDPWFYRILINECNRLMKKESKLSYLHNEELNEDMEIVEEEQDLYQYSDLYEAVQGLKDMYRIPIILKYIKGFAEKEIADILQLNHNTVKTRLFKAREKLKKQLEQLKRREQHG